MNYYNIIFLKKKISYLTNSIKVERKLIFKKEMFKV